MLRVQLKKAAVALCLSAGVCALSPIASAQDPGAGVFAEPDLKAVDWDAQRVDPPRVWFQFGGGFTLRLVQDRDFAQDPFAPAFLDTFGAIVLPSSDLWRHGIGLGASFNLVSDGGVLEGVDALQQFVFTPSYLAHLRFSEDFVVHGKFGIPWVLSPESSLGLQLDLGVTGLLTASLGVYVEAGLATFLGAEGTIHPTLSFEAGLSIDYEVLP